ncbi:MAG: hypothetical protein MUD14_21195 [Hydrococcus sp. Prado102]|jgi:hypothetical protein|nr:hypothetical protein [Hydrococcus sp. Prado102]
MTVLTETLEQLEYWLWQNYPDLATSLNPGLTFEEIENLVQDLPVQITTEIREFYQWANGCGLFATPFFHEPLGIMPLEKAIQYSYDESEKVSEIVMQLVELPIPNLVMFWEFERWIHFAVCDGNESSPILVVTDDYYTRLAYSSLTSMALTTLECYEKEIFKIEKGWKTPRIFDGSLALVEEFNSIRKRNNAAFNSNSIRELYNIKIE